MSAGLFYLPFPGSIDAVKHWIKPACSLETCTHARCERLRAIASAECVYCDQPIGWGCYVTDCWPPKERKALDSLDTSGWAHDACAPQCEMCVK